MYIAKSTVHEIMGRLDAIALAEEYIRIEKRGGRYWGRCPFHSGGQEKTPSFTVDPDQKLYYCFACNKGGGIIDFIMEMDKISYPDALKNLARKYGVSIVYENGGEYNKKDEDAYLQKEQLYELYRRTALSFHHLLKENPEGKKALDYLLSRKISMEMIDKFQLGYSKQDQNWLYGFLQKKGYSEQFLEKSGMFSSYNKSSAFFCGRLMFPISDKQGRIAAFGGRHMSSEEDSSVPKYINTREIDIYKKGQILYGLNVALPEIRQSKTVYIAEGYLDVIAMHQAGISNTVAPCGTSLTEEQVKLLRRWADHVILVFDSDEAGQRAAFKGIIICRQNNLACSLALPYKTGEGEELKDPAEILQKFDENTLKNSMNHVIIDIEYLIAKGEAVYNISRPRGKAQVCEMLFPYLASLNSASEREDSIGLISDRIHIEKSSILSDFNRWQHSAKNPVAKPFGNKPLGKEENGKKISISMNDEMFLLIVVLVNYNLYQEFRALVKMHEIENLAAKEIFVALEECFINGESSTEAALARISSVELRNFIIKRGISPEFKGDQKRNPRKLMEDGINALKIKRFKQRRVEINAELRNKERNIQLLSENDLLNLIEEQMYIDAEIKKLEGN